MEHSGIPMIDFSAFLDGSAKQEVGDKIVAAFKDIGFVYLTNHGIPSKDIAEMFALVKKFFAQPMEVKELAPHPASGAHHRGYSRPGREKVVHDEYEADKISEARALVPDVKESFECGREGDPIQANIWLPEGVFPGFEETCLDFFWLCHKVENNILRALAIGLALPEDYFLQYHTVADNQLRLLHYPSVPAGDLAADKIARIGAHTDYDSITLLLQDDVGGLEVEDPREPGLFRPAPPVPGTLIVNAGDFLMRWSNDTIRSTMHRVRAPTSMVNMSGMIPERYSIPYFCSADPDTIVDCIPGTWDEEHSKKYEPISAQEYVKKRLLAAY
ncbi:thymine dioxygenase [Mycena alexandri]|uniref:Thymine dioxygenase n=1 Tax=Mycena alexandri TaxID=1745969 RepID=A0AAD6SGC9_9AGAR|nr:thymine dioxygenase [Mycena alexandri]